tara:strand:+ start:446 stop:1933 length:1488 start_codon:yes stop_codon:yes gene_type:complete
MKVLFYSHNLRHYRFYKKIKKSNYKKNNKDQDLTFTILDNGEYRLKDRTEKVDFWIEKFYRNISFSEKECDLIIDKYRSFDLPRWIETDRVISFYRQYLNLSLFSRLEIKRFVASCFLGFEEYLDKNNIDFIFSELIIGVQDAILYEVAKLQGIKWVGIRNSRMGRGFVFTDPYTEMPLEFNVKLSNYRHNLISIPIEIRNNINEFVLNRKENLKPPAYMKFTIRKGSFININNLVRFFEIVFMLPDWRIGSNRFIMLNLCNRIIYWLKRARNLYLLRYSKITNRLFIDIKYLDKKKYIIFPLQFEPEATASVRAYPNHNQIEIIKYISSIINDDTFLIVKEHKGNEGYRLISDYQNIVELKNVCLLNNKDISNKELIEKSLGVITINSTLGVEAYLNNKPVITFGRSYWRDLDGITKFDDFKDLSMTFMKQFFNNKKNIVKHNNNYFDYFAAYESCVNNGTFLALDKNFLKDRNISYFKNAIFETINKINTSIC